MRAGDACRVERQRFQSEVRQPRVVISPRVSQPRVVTAPRAGQPRLESEAARNTLLRERHTSQREVKRPPLVQVGPPDARSGRRIEPPRITRPEERPPTRPRQP